MAAAVKTTEVSAVHVPHISVDLNSQPRFLKLASRAAVTGPGQNAAEKQTLHDEFVAEAVKTQPPPANLNMQSTPACDESSCNVYGKIDRNLAMLAPGRRPLVLLCNGAFNPIHRQHARIFYLAREECIFPI